MIILDTDHLSELLERRSTVGKALRLRLKQSREPIAVSIVSVEELLRGWLALIHRRSDPHSQIGGYLRLHEFVVSIHKWTVLEWTTEHADRFLELRSAKIRSGSMDLKIAVTALMEGATLLTRNTTDFESIPGLSIDNWLD
jgi:tRNA(fMet)-specific endonuclease VapC